MLRTAVVDMKDIRPPVQSRRRAPHLVLAPCLRGAHAWEVVGGHGTYWKLAKTRRARIPCLVRDEATVEPLELLLEHNAVGTLTAVEEARAIATVVRESGWSQRQLAERMGSLQPHISKRLLLLELTSQEQADLEDGRMTLSEAEATARRRRKSA